MIKLFEIDTNDNLPKISLEARTLEPFKTIFNRDKSKAKDLAFRELAFVYWSGVFDSQYEYFEDLEKVARLIKDTGLPETWKPDNQVQIAIEFFIDSQRTRSSKYLESSRKAIESISNYLDTINVSETIEAGPKKGELVHDINKIRATIKDMPEMVKSMNDIKAMVQEELKEEPINRAGRKTNKYNE